jgi:diguanylate cyclase (GGDEF)-like protein
MKPSSHQKKSDSARPERSWRFHHVLGINRDRARGAKVEQRFDDSVTVCEVATEKRTRSNWFRAATERFLGAEPSFESVLHRFTVESQSASDAAMIESAILTAATTLYPKGRFEFMGLRASANDDATPEPTESKMTASDSDGSSTHRDFPVCTGNAFHGRLRVHHTTGGMAAYSPTLVQRLTTLCTIAASALENLRYHEEWSKHSRLSDPDEFNGKLSFTFDTARPATTPVCSSLRDATFLSAIFPFALSQAQRYRESLSVLCVGVDRIGGVRELLGQEVVNRLLERVGQIVASTIRSSDIVARLDDDRIVALLVRSPGYSALHVGQTICRKVAETETIIPELPSATISIGVAAYPSHACNCYALFDAADDALVQAQAQGAGSVAIAPRPESTSSTLRPRTNGSLKNA